MSTRLRKMRLSRARVARAEKSATPDPTGKFVTEAHDLDAARRSVEDAASVSAGLWLSYLFTLLYIAIAAGAVTHSDLLLQNPVKLPFLGVELPLVAFFLFAPILFIVLHAYTLVHFVMLGAKVGVFDDELRRQLPNATDTGEGLRRQLPSNIFVQFLAGPVDIREGVLGLLLKLIAWSSLVIGPVLLLLLIQVQFLPYHLEWVTWVQRFAVLIDVVLLWTLWPAVLNGRSRIEWPPLWRYPIFTLVSLAPIGLAFTAATFPGERMEDWLGDRQTIPPQITSWFGLKDDNDQLIWTSFHDLLFHGKYDETRQRRKSLFSNTLVLPGFDALEAAKIDDPKKLDAVKQTLALHGRHLENAIFFRADLRKAYLGDAHLQGAVFYQAKLQGAWFYRAKLQGASLYQAKLQCASLDNAQLQGAWLEDAELQGAYAHEAHLQGASLKGAKLQGASLEKAKLEGASLARDSSLEGAELQGANFQNTTLTDTDMSGTAVWRANFDHASLAAVSEDGIKESAMLKDKFDNLHAIIMKEAPEGEQRKNALERIGKLNPDIAGNETSVRETLEKRSVAETADKQSLADQLKTLACSNEEDTLSIVRGLIANDRIKDTGAKAPGLVEAILKPDCPVSVALTEVDKAALTRIAKEASAVH